MNATILCVGKLKEKWQQEGCAEYLKRLSRYGKYEIVQIDDLREPDNASPAQIKQIIDREGKNLLARADARLSFSNLTFPHGLMRVILLEQLYRAERIRTGEKYHK